MLPRLYAIPNNKARREEAIYIWTIDIKYHPSSSSWSSESEKLRETNFISIKANGAKKNYIP